MRSRTIDLDGPVHYADFGGTGPTLVLVHGLGGSHVNWMAVAPALARDARVLAVDLAGFGRTPLGERSADVHANRILLDRFLEAVAAGPVVLVGNSMGGLVAMMEAALAPERVAGLVLVAPAQPRSAEARMDGRVAALFLYALPVLGELALRWRARLLGPAGQGGSPSVRRRRPAGDRRGCAAADCKKRGATLGAPGAELRDSRGRSSVG